MKLGYKIVLLLSLSIIGSFSAATIFELSKLTKQFSAENQNQHMIILANLTTNLSGALYNLDEKRVKRQLEAGFEFGSIERITVLDDSGNIVTAFENKQNGQRPISEVMDLSLAKAEFAQNSFNKPIYNFNVNIMKMIAVSSLSDDSGKRLIIPLWYEKEDKSEFMGHVIMDYSDHLVKAAVLDSARDKVLAYSLLAILILVLSFLFLRIAVIGRLERLKFSVQCIENRDYSHSIEVKGKDEIAELAHAFKVMASEVEAYQQDLESKVRDRTFDLKESRDKMKLILDNIEQGIVSFDSKLLIENEFSRHAVDIINGAGHHFFDETNGAADRSSSETQKVLSSPAGHSIIDLIFSESSLSNDEVSQIEAVVCAVIGEDVLAFEVNSHCFPSEIRRGLSSSQQIVELSWVPISNDSGIVQKIVLSMRDVTRLRILEEESQRTRQETQFISEILNAPIARYLRLIKHARELIDDSKKLIQRHFTLQNLDEIMRDLFINIHTLKGESRALGFKHLTAVLHNTEESYEQLRKSPSELLSSEMLSVGLEDAQKALDVYVNIAEQKLGRTENEELKRQVTSSKLEGLYQSLVNIEKNLSGQQIKELFHPLKAMLIPMVYRSALTLFEDIFSSVPRLAIDLKKAPPRCNFIEIEGIFLTSIADRALQQAFTHLFRNSMDHGVETAEQRVAKGKPSEATLTVKFSQEQDHLVIQYFDDGRGLDLEKIRKIALSKNLLEESDSGLIEKLARLIALPGFSTAEHVSEVSGRGVGVGAVEHLIRQVQGSFDITVSSTKGCGAFCDVIFEIRLPSCHFVSLKEPVAPTIQLSCA